MRGVDVIRTALQSTQQLLTWFLSDLDDADLLVRPVPGANHIAWQVGHLIQSEQGLVKGEITKAKYPELPAGFAEHHAMERNKTDGPDGFATKAVYLDLFAK